VLKTRARFAARCKLKLELKPGAPRLPHPSRHHQSDLFFVSSRGVDFSSDRSVIHDEYPICERQHLFELGGNEKDRSPSITQLDQLSMNKLDCADVHAACRLRYQQKFRAQIKFPSNNQLLLVSTRKRPRLQFDPWWSDIKVVNQPACVARDCRQVEQS